MMHRDRIVNFLINALALIPTLGFGALILAILSANIISMMVPMPGEPSLNSMAKDCLTIGFWVFWVWGTHVFFIGRGSRRLRRWLGMLGGTVVGCLVIVLSPHPGQWVWAKMIVVAILVIMLDDAHKKGDPKTNRVARNPA